MFNRKKEEMKWTSKLYQLKHSGQKTDKGVGEVGGGGAQCHNVPPSPMAYKVNNFIVKNILSGP